MGLAQSLYMKEHRSHWIQFFSMRFEKSCIQDSTVCFRYNALNQHQIQVMVTSDHGEIIAKGSFNVVEGSAIHEDGIDYWGNQGNWAKHSY
ncbi:hypothetical protein D3C71_1994160 [compost metagenome]